MLAGTFRSPIDVAITSASDTHGHDHAQHGRPGGHLGAIDTGNIELIGRMRINQDKEGRASDVGVFGNHAYVGAFFEPKCQKGGVYVFDLSNPSPSTTTSPDHRRGQGSLGVVLARHERRGGGRPLLHARLLLGTVATSSSTSPIR